MRDMASDEGDPRHSKDDGAVETVAKHARTTPIGRIALIGAGAIALVAVGVKVYQDNAATPAAPPATPATAQQAQPDVGAMIAQLEARMQANPGDAEGWRMLGWSYYRTEQFPKAVAAYRKATEVDPKDAESWSALGEAIALAAPPPGGVPPESEAAFRKALAIDPANPRARYFLGVKKDLAGDHEGAIRDWIALLNDTPAGAPWEGSVRQTITQVAEANKIDVSGRLPAPKAAPAAESNAATDAIPGPSREQMAAAASMPPSQQSEMVRGMVEGLAQKLKADPKNADGWLRLMRARMVLGETDKAAEALRTARTAFAGDQATLAKLSEGAKALGVPGV
jgi:cytochrome c-type biogenesis protein CcmH